MAKPPAQPSSSQDITAFLRKRQAISEFVGQQARLLFAVDASASRQPTWEQASHLQQEMFRASDQIADLAVQLCYYRGFGEFQASPWLRNSAALARLMGRVYCEGGHTQIAKLLRHARAEHSKADIRAVVFIGDAIEENPDTLCDLSGQCGLVKLPLFMFQEGHTPQVTDTFRHMAQLSGGAYARFDASSAATLAA